MGFLCQGGAFAEIHIRSHHREFELVDEQRQVAVAFIEFMVAQSHGIVPQGVHDLGAVLSVVHHIEQGADEGIAGAQQNGIFVGFVFLGDDAGCQRLSAVAGGCSRVVRMHIVGMQNRQVEIGQWSRSRCGCRIDGQPARHSAGCHAADRQNHQQDGCDELFGSV